MKYFLIFLLLVFSAKAHANENTTNEDICFTQEEILSDVLMGYMAIMGQAAIECDTKNQTDKYTSASYEFLSSNKKNIEQYSRHIKSVCDKLGINHLQCIQERGLATMNNPKKGPLFENCDELMNNLIKAKSEWGIFITQVLGLAVLIEDKYPKCQ